MNRSLIFAAALSCVMGSASMAQDSARTAQSNASLQEFVQKAGTSGLAEVEMGELGAKKAKNGQVEAFAKRMVADHTKANQELLTAIKGKGVQVPSSRTDTHKAMVENAADDAKFDLDLRAYAKRTLPTLRDHLKQAQTIRDKLTD